MPFPVLVFLLSSCGRMMVRIAVVCTGICRIPVCRGLRFTVRDLRRAAYPASHTAISFRKPAEFCGISLTSRGKTVTIKSSLKSLTFYRGVAQLVARLLWEQDVGSSSLFTSTRLSLDAIRAPGSNAFCFDKHSVRHGSRRHGGVPRRSRISAFRALLRRRRIAV